jgi:Tfp pilus assembly protein PilX
MVKFRGKTRRTGNIIVISLVFLFLFAFLAASVSYMSRREYHQTFRTINQNFAFLAARSLLAEAEAEIREKANLQFKSNFLDYSKKHKLPLTCENGPETKKMEPDLIALESDGTGNDMPWEISIDKLKVMAFIYKETASLPKGLQTPSDRVRFVKIEAMAEVNGAKKELWLVLAVKVVDVRPVANEYVLYVVDGDFKGFNPSSGVSKGKGKRANPNFDKWVNHKVKAANRFAVQDLKDYRSCAYRISQSLDNFYQGNDLYVEGMAYVPTRASLKPFTRIRYPGMILARDIIINGEVKADTAPPGDHNAVPRIALVGTQAQVKTNAAIQASIATIRSINSGTKNIDILGNHSCSFLTWQTGFNGTITYDPHLIDSTKGFLADQISLKKGSVTKTVKGCWVVSISPIPVLWSDAYNVERN